MNEGLEVTSKLGAVAATPEAARLGVRLLEAGGNAFDAAAGAAIACCMLEPNQTGIGGYACSAVVRCGCTGELWSVDGDAVAPAAAHERMFEILASGKPGPGAINEGEYACSVRDNANVFGPLAVAVPGLLAGVGILHERWGRLPWPDILAPSQRLLTDGFPYGQVADAFARMRPVLDRFPDTVKHLSPDGNPPRPDDIWHRPDMEKTLDRLATAGWRDFYEGELAGCIVEHIRQLGGILTRADMAAYVPGIEPPHCVRYHGAEVAGARLPNGSFTPLQALAMLAHLDLPATDDAVYFHRLAEVLKLVWRDRLNWLGDPAFDDVPIDRLLNPDYLAGRVEGLRQFPRAVDQLCPDDPVKPPNGTRHISAADRDGNLVSLTITQGGAFGSCVTVPGTGIILGHGMCRFDPRPGRRNSVRPGRRMLNNMCPMIVETPDRAVALGLPGGRLIVSVMTRALQLVIDRGYTAHEAAVAPRLHIEAAEPLILARSLPQSLRDELRAMGHGVKPQEPIAGPMHGAEFLKSTATVRGGSSSFAAASSH